MTKDAARDSKAPELFSKEMLPDPYRVYADLRRERPLYWDDELGGWVASRYAEATAILKDRRFSSNRVAGVRDRFADPELAPLFDTLSLLMVQRDGADHDRLRRLVQQAFGRTAVERYAPRIEAIVDTLLGAALARGHMEFVRDLAVPLPIRVISQIVGIPEVDRLQVKTWCDDFSLAALNFYARITEAELRRGAESVRAFKAYLAERAAVLRAAPDDSLLAGLVLAEVEGSRLAMDELLANVLLLLNAGNETTTGLLANGLLALLQHPDQLQRLRQDPSLVPQAVEEFLRFDAPVQFLARVAREEIAIGGQRLAAGDLVFVLLGSAGRDEAHFEHPDRLDVGRTRNRHLAFGSGTHVCTGLQLARLEARIAFTRVLELLPAFALDPEPLQRQANFNLRCPARLPLRLAA